MPSQRSMPWLPSPEGFRAGGYMESESLYEVERIADERRDQSGRREFLVQWKDYGPDSDTWEPEENLVACEEALQEFRLRRAKENSDGAPCRVRGPPSPAAQLTARPQQNSQEPKAAVFLPTYQSTATTRLLSGSPRLRATNTRATLKIKMPLLGSPKNKRLRLETVHQDYRQIQVSAAALDPEEAAVPTVKVEGPNLSAADTELPHKEGSPCPDQLQGLQSCCPDTEPKPLGLTRGEGGRSLRKSDSAGPGGSVRKAFLPKERPVLETLARFMWSQDDSHHPYKDIIVRKQEAFTHIILFSRSSRHNCLNPGVMQEMQLALSTAAEDDSRFVLLGAAGSSFCGGLDLAYLSRSLGAHPAMQASSKLKSFVHHFIHFRKPLVVAVQGPAIGLGASILALCDIVWSSDKAWFQTPYMAQGLAPHGCSSITFPKIMGGVAASEILFSGRKLTAQEACNKGLVSQVFSQDTFTQEVMARVTELASYHPLLLEECKTLMCCSTKADLEQANIRECEVLKSILASSQGAHSLLKLSESTDAL